MPTERRGPFFNSQYEGIPDRVVDNGSAQAKMSGTVACMFDDNHHDAFTQFRRQGQMRFTMTGDSRQSSPVFLGSYTAQRMGAVAQTIAKPFNAVANEWSYMKPVVAAVLYWAITIGGVIGMGNLGHYILTNADKQETQFMGKEIKAPVPEPRLK